MFKASSYYSNDNESFVLVETPSLENTGENGRKQFYHFFVDQSGSMNATVEGKTTTRIEEAAAAAVEISNSSVGATTTNSWVTGWDHEIHPTYPIDRTLKKEHVIKDLVEKKLQPLGGTELSALRGSLLSGGVQVLTELAQAHQGTNARYNIIVLTDAQLYSSNGFTIDKVVQDMIAAMPCSLGSLDVRAYGVGIGLSGLYVRVFNEIFPCSEQRVISHDPKAAVDKLFGCPFVDLSFQSCGPPIRMSGVSGGFGQEFTHSIQLRPSDPCQLRLNAASTEGFQLKVRVGGNESKTVDVPSATFNVPSEHQTIFLQRAIDSLTKNRLPELASKLANHADLSDPQFPTTVLEPALTELQRSVFCLFAELGVVRHATPWFDTMNSSLMEAINTVRAQMVSTHQQLQDIKSSRDPTTIRSRIEEAKTKIVQLQEQVDSKTAEAASSAKRQKVENSAYRRRSPAGALTYKLQVAKSQLATLETTLDEVLSSNSSAESKAESKAQEQDSVGFLEQAFKTLGLQSRYRRNNQEPTDLLLLRTTTNLECTICAMPHFLVTTACCRQPTICYGCATSLSTCPFCRCAAPPNRRIGLLLQGNDQPTIYPMM